MIIKRFSVAACFMALFLLLAGTVRGQSERKMARKFVSIAAEGIPAQVSPPSFLYKYNLKTGILDSITYANAREKDSILWVHSDFIRRINDSVFIARFMKGYLSELKKYGFRLKDTVYGNNGYRIHVAQIELEEQYYHYADTAYYGNGVYVHRQKLNALDVSSWFQVQGPMIKSPKGKVLFAENLLTDDMEGHFAVDPYSGNIKFLYTLDSLTVKKIYSYAQNLGRTYAGYTFDYLLNTFLNRKLPASRRTDRYWRYDPYRKKLFVAYDDRFVPLDN